MQHKPHIDLNYKQ